MFSLKKSNLKNCCCLSIVMTIIQFNEIMNLGEKIKHAHPDSKLGLVPGFYRFLQICYEKDKMLKISPIIQNLFNL